MELFTRNLRVGAAAAAAAVPETPEAGRAEAPGSPGGPEYTLGEAAEFVPERMWSFF